MSNSVSKGPAHQGHKKHSFFFVKGLSRILLGMKRQNSDAVKFIASADLTFKSSACLY